MIRSLRNLGVFGRTSAARLASRAGGDGSERSTRAAFTLVELLVAAAAVIIVAGGLAQIFRMTGETVSSGRKLSFLTTYAASIERQLRADFTSMTRDGYMIIRSSGVDADGDLQYTPSRIGNPSPDAVPLSARDQDPRSRRADELMFFMKGDFTTVREPRHPTRVAKSTEARVYYGHARRRQIANTFGLPYLNLDDSNQIATGTPPEGGDEQGVATGLGVQVEGNPNRYAADWLLVRHVALLTPPNGVEQDSLLATTVGTLPRGLGLGVAMRDSDWQVALQPAAPSVFRRLNLVSPVPTGADVARPSLGGGSFERFEVPFFSCGAVDIATTSLAEVRSIVLGAASFPADLTAVGQKLTLAPFQGPANPPQVPQPQVPVEQLTLQRMQEWMMQGMPADSDGLGPNGTPEIGLDRRIRAELTPPNLQGFPGSGDYDRTDQLALSASVFVPGCSEFIVEWSFGEIDTDAQSPTRGRTVWYGQERMVDVAQDGTLPPAQGAPPTGNPVNYWIRPYTGPDPTQLPTDAYNAQKLMTVTRRDGSKFTRSIARSVVSPDPYFSPALRYDPAAPPGTGLQPSYSTFGYVDPTYAPRTPLGKAELARRGLVGRVPQDGDTAARVEEFGYVLIKDRNGNGRYDVNPDPNINADPNNPAGSDVIAPMLQLDVNGNGEYDGPDGDVLLDPETVPWPWPKLVRITMSLADPTDPTVERQFQFILTVPPPSKSSQF